jgi:signal peptide peptidase SppA
MKSLKHISNIVHGTPWMIEDRALDFIADIFARHVAGETIVDARQAAKLSPEFHPQYLGAVKYVGEPSNAAGEPFYANRGGVAQIAVAGPILPRAGMMSNLSSFATSCEKIGNSIEAAMEDEDIKAVQLLIDSPGGSVLGGFELSDKMHAMKSKPMIACIEGVGASLAYLISSQCNEIYATRGSIVGSIGVIARMPRDERAERNAGIDTITVASSRDKAMSGLSEGEIRARLEKEVQMYFGLFKEAIARGRPGMTLETTATGETWLACDAPSGLLDGIATPDEILSALEKIL